MQCYVQVLNIDKLNKTPTCVIAMQIGFIDFKVTAMNRNILIMLKYTYSAKQSIKLRFYIESQ